MRHEPVAHPFDGRGVGMKGRPFILRAENARARMAAAWDAACAILERPGASARVVVEECQPTRTLDQNALMWTLLHDIARQVEWPVDGRMQKIDAEDWKHILSAGLKRHQRVAQGIDGGFVILGQRTSRMNIGEMSDLIELIHAFGSERDVRWSDERRAAA